MNNKFKKLMLIMVSILLINSVSYARLIGPNNNKNSWVSKINQSLDTVANHFVDSVVQDDIEDEKFKGMEANEVIKYKRYEALMASYSNAKKGDIITLGKFEQDNNIENGKEDIEWIVLDTMPNRILIMSKYILDNMTYHPTFNSVTWEKCEIRKFLNGEFLETSFDEEEIKLPLETNLENANNKLYNSIGGNSTKDKVFILSIDDHKKYYEKWEGAAAYGTPYAIARGLWVSNMVPYDKTSVWWLRSPGQLDYYAAYVNVSGSIGYSGDNVTTEGNGIRPAMWIQIKK